MPIQHVCIGLSPALHASRDRFLSNSALAKRWFGSGFWSKSRRSDDQLRSAQVVTGVSHTGLLRSDFSAIALEGKHDGRCNLLALDGQLRYTLTVSNDYRIVLLRSDGSALTVGVNHDGRCNILASDDKLQHVVFLVPFLQHRGIAVYVSDSMESLIDRYFVCP